MKEKDNFLIYHNQYSLVEELNDIDKGLLFESLFQYSMNKELPKFEKGSPLSMAFKSMKNAIDISNEKYLEKCKRNQENINKRYEKEKYSDKCVFLDNKKISYEVFQKVYKKGYTNKYGETLSFSQIFEDQFNTYSEGGDIILLKENYKCNNIDSEEVNEYFEQYLN